MQEHSHPPEDDNVEILELFERLKEKIPQQLETPIPTIFKNFLISLPAASRINFPAFT